MKVLVQLSKPFEHFLFLLTCRTSPQNKMLNDAPSVLVLAEDSHSRLISTTRLSSCQIKSMTPCFREPCATKARLDDSCNFTCQVEERL
jgi:hypothetical protein